MSDCFDYSSDDTEDDDQYREEEINCNEYDDDDFYNSDDQYNGRNQLSDYASEGTNRTDSEEESFNSNVVDLPGGKTKLWKPIVPKDFMPYVDAIYQSLEEAVEMYKLYADKAGFGVRLNTVTRFGDKTIKKRYVVCNKMGKIPNRSTDTLDPEGSGRNKRNSNFKITDCKALIKFERLHMQTNACKIYEFEENHNHPLETKEERRYSKRARRLSYKDKEFIARSSTSNIGATKAHKLQASLQGGYENVGPEAIDYKNFRRKVGNIIGDKDAQLVVDKTNMRKDELHNYTFEYKCVDSVLNAMFWADETDKLYYKEFGDVISFDATFRTNTYGMIFVPFTAVDNHKRSINIGAGLLSNESIESYRWLLEAFLKAHVKHPQLVLTDQDPAILQAVEAIFPTSNHRLCMWHIMKKLQAKVSADFLKNTNFRKRFTKLVWNVYIEPEVFESRWNLLMRKFKLQDKRWFKDMYRDRKLWIPAYFKDIPLHDLMKTTLRSESVNSFFNKYSNSGNLLIYFMMNYDTAIGKQRNAQQKLEHDTKNAKHEMTLPSGLLEHAAAVYTKKISMRSKRKYLKQPDTVELKLPKKEVKCSCNHFIRTGILCRHIFVVLKNNHIEEIPEQYILRRWRRDAISSHLLAMKHVSMEVEDDTFKLLTEEAMEFGSSNQTSSDNDEEEIIRMLGIRSIPDEINIHPPASIRTKGSGTKKRMVSAIEKAVAEAKKKTRMCTGCNQYVNHNWRTYKMNNSNAKFGNVNRLMILSGI
ncbi:protein FAR1-RELATED SEQUENCE 5-like [Lactuca sativa]|uniref:protein FAR1-RELATED SEQUENCE 5-like n=1 Tax=Lactuca sativa TaxID=4236 RepID=UPI0022AF0470|nr:protein FAR1-RELATED SEQUENCE 5-like [Lactuca sativa]